MAMLAIPTAANAGLGLSFGAGLVDEPAEKERFVGIFRMGSPVEETRFRLFLDVLYIWDNISPSKDAVSPISDRVAGVLLEFQYLLSDSFLISFMPGGFARSREFEVGSEHGTLNTSLKMGAGFKVARIFSTPSKGGEFELAGHAYYFPSSSQRADLGGGPVSLNLDASFATFLTFGFRGKGGVIFPLFD